MAKVTISEWYKRVNASWPADVPDLKPSEALAAAKKLYRFAFGQSWTGSMVITSGNRYTWIRRDTFRVNPDRREGIGSGWKALVHDLSHYAHYKLHPGIKPHSGQHARLEIAMIKEVVKRGWLAGALVESVQPEKPKADLRTERYDRILARVTSWERKQKRAENALKKLRKQARYYERAISISSTQ